MGMPLRVLLVEDDTDLREALSDALSESGHAVETAADGIEGLRQLRETRPDVVVLDLMMPKLDGWQFRLAQRQDPMIATTPVVAISASSSPTAAAVDADAFLRKPLDAGELNKAIEDVFAAHLKRLEPARIAETDRLATLGMLTAALAHEINNPLTYLLIELAHLVRQLPELADRCDPARIDELVGHARDALHGAQRIRGIMAGVRTFSRVDENASGPCDVRVPLEAALQLVGNELRNRARVVTELGEAPLVLGNEGRLGQVFLNLLTNAMHALPEGSAQDHEVRVTTSVDDAGDIVVEIADTGAGIPAHVVEHVFEPFFSTKPVGQGTGLGLSISRSIIAAHGGTIGVRSEPGKGATFRIVLPAIARS
jgi:signal transduction histidine kinase